MSEVATAYRDRKTSLPLSVKSQSKPRNDQTSTESSPQPNSNINSSANAVGYGYEYGYSGNSNDDEAKGTTNEDDKEVDKEVEGEEIDPATYMSLCGLECADMDVYLRECAERFVFHVHYILPCMKQFCNKKYFLIQCNVNTILRYS